MRRLLKKKIDGDRRGTHVAEIMEGLYFMIENVTEYKITRKWNSRIREFRVSQ